MRWNAPLSEAHAALLIDRLGLGAGMSVLDLGCGWAELLTRVVQSGASPACTGIGVDTDETLLERGRALVRERGLDQQISLIDAPAEEWSQPADRLICVGASHAWGGTREALRALSGLVAPGGRLLFGDGCWEQDATPAAAAIFPEVLPLVELVEDARQEGWRTLHLSTAGQREWDEFESSWRLGREQWLAANPEADGAGALRTELDELLATYVGSYRGILGFCYVVLGR